MTATVFNIEPDRVIVATDTLAMAGETDSPFVFTTKVYPVPHLQSAMFATGIGEFATHWFTRLAHFLARDILDLDKACGPALREMGRQFGLNENRITTVYHVGYSEAEQRYVGFAYRSNNRFASERLEYGLRTKPGVAGAKASKFPDDYIKIMKEQRAADSILPVKQRAFIGGEIQALVLQNKTITQQTLYRFDDFEELYGQMRAVQATAQVAAQVSTNRMKARF